MNSPEPAQCRTIRLSHALLLVALCLLFTFSAVASAPLAAPRPPHRGSSTAPSHSSAVRSVTSSSHSHLPPSSFSSSSSSSHQPFPPLSTSTPRPSSLSSTQPPSPPPASWTSSSPIPSSVAVYDGRMSLSRMLSLVFVSLIFLVLVISFVWYFWRRQWLAQRQHSSHPLSDDGWLRIDERGVAVRDGVQSVSATTPYQPSMLSYMAPSPTPAALTISYQPHADTASERHFVRF